MSQSYWLFELDYINKAIPIEEPDSYDQCIQSIIESSKSLNLTISEIENIEYPTDKLPILICNDMSFGLLKKLMTENMCPTLKVNTKKSMIINCPKSSPKSSKKKIECKLNKNEQNHENKKIHYALCEYLGIDSSTISGTCQDSLVTRFNTKSQKISKNFGKSYHLLPYRYTMGSLCK